MPGDQGLGFAARGLGLRDECQGLRAEDVGLGFTAPEERTKMRGMAAVESAYTAGRSKGGASMNRSPRDWGFGIRD